MTFDVSYSSRSRKFLKKVDKILAKRLVEKIENLWRIQLFTIQKQSKALKVYLEYELAIIEYYMK